MGARLDDLGFRDCSISVNVSGRQLIDVGFVASLERALLTHGVPRARLGIEITESVALRDPNLALEILNACKALGALVLLDDFGTQYSSLAYLKKFPIDVIKIDKSFVEGLPGNSDDRGIVDAIIALGATLEYAVLAEGVESEIQASWLHLHGCHLVTGFHYARPMPASEFERWLERSDRENCDDVIANATQA